MIYLREYLQHLTKGKLNINTTDHLRETRKIIIIRIK